MTEVSVLEVFRRMDVDSLSQLLDPSGIYSDLRTPDFIRCMAMFFDDLKGYHDAYFLRDMAYYRIISDHITGDERGYAYMDSERCYILLLKLTVKDTVVVNIESMPYQELGTFSLEFYPYQSQDFEHLSVFEIYEEDKLNYDEASLPSEVAARKRAVEEIRHQSELAPVGLEFLKKWYAPFEPFSCIYEPDSKGRFFRINETFEGFAVMTRLLLRWDKDISLYQEAAKAYKTLWKYNRWGKIKWATRIYRSAICRPDMPFVVMDGTIQHLGIRVDVSPLEDVIFTYNRFSELKDKIVRP